MFSINPEIILPLIVVVLFGSQIVTAIVRAIRTQRAKRTIQIGDTVCTKSGLLGYVEDMKGKRCRVIYFSAPDSYGYWNRKELRPVR